MNRHNFFFPAKHLSSKKNTKNNRNRTTNKWREEKRIRKKTHKKYIRNKHRISITHGEWARATREMRLTFTYGALQLTNESVRWLAETENAKYTIHKIHNRFTWRGETLSTARTPYIRTPNVIRNNNTKVNRLWRVYACVCTISSSGHIARQSTYLHWRLRFDSDHFCDTACCFYSLLFASLLVLRFASLSHFTQLCKSHTHRLDCMQTLWDTDIAVYTVHLHTHTSVGKHRHSAKAFVLNGSIEIANDDALDVLLRMYLALYIEPCAIAQTWRGAQTHNHSDIWTVVRVSTLSCCFLIVCCCCFWPFSSNFIVEYL